MQTSFVKKNMLLLAVFWSIVVIFAMGIYLWMERGHTIERVTVRTRTLLERDLLYRSWGVTKGGIYVRVSERHQPNPHLAFLPNRDIQLPSGDLLTLMTPSNITQQAFELSNQSGETLSKITAIKVVNPANTADAWELAAIDKFEQGAEEVTGVSELYGKQYVRTMRPFITEEKCVKCHSAQGYDVGEIRGGLSISIPLEPVLAETRSKNYPNLLMFVALWLMGLVGISMQCRRLKDQTDLAVEHQKERDQAEMRLHYMSNYDRRTNLPNRYQFEEWLRTEVEQISEQGQWTAVVAFESTHFRRVVETHGESLGDAYLRSCAERIAIFLHVDGIIARLGESRLIFTLFNHDELPGIGSTFREIEESLRQPLDVAGEKFFPTPCLGVAFCPGDGKLPKELMQMAVSALDRALERGVGGFELYSRALQAEAQDRLVIDNGLRAALEDERFILHYQPQVDGRTGEVVGVEALLRWIDEDGSFIPPNRFIPIAEDNGLILPIGAWVIRTACHQAAEWHRQTGRNLCLGVNVSAKQFRDPTLVDLIDRVLKTTGFPPERLEVEITEGTFMENPDKTIEILTDLKVLGVKIAIDDFGTGYSSLNYLKKFPVDRLKIDRSFVIDLTENEDDRVIVSLITGIADNMELDVIAEGVETRGQRDLLLELGCDNMQGFYYSKPLPASEFIHSLTNGYKIGQTAP